MFADTTICPTPTPLPPSPPAQTPLTDPDPSASQSTNNTGLIAGIFIMSVVNILLTLVLVFVVSMKLKRFHRNDGSGLQETTIHAYDYPTMEIRTRNSTNMDENVATVEASPTETYSMKITTERNAAYGTKHQLRHGANEESNTQD